MENEFNDIIQNKNELNYIPKLKECYYTLLPIITILILSSLYFASFSDEITHITILQILLSYSLTFAITYIILYYHKLNNI